MTTVRANGVVGLIHGGKGRRHKWQMVMQPARCGGVRRAWARVHGGDGASAQGPGPSPPPPPGLPFVICMGYHGILFVAVWKR